ncbi:hypothetical protein HQ560_10930 [bacterium]|nr:hypothetical protein [bacterium]
MSIHVRTGRTVSLFPLIALSCLAFNAWAHAGTGKYEVGGPLAGPKLPLFQGEHGSPPGYPGVVPKLLDKDGDMRDMGTQYKEWGPQGLAPEVELYPGAVEHWRAYWFKYCPVRSIFDRQSQIRNWTAPAIPGAAPARIESYAEPVYWIPRHAAVRNTGLARSPVKVVRWTPVGSVFKLDLGELAPSLYAVRVIAAVETDRLRVFRRPAFLRLEVNDGLEGQITQYRRRIGYCDEFYSVCEFYFHAPERRVYRVELSMDTRSEVDLLVRNISLDDTLAGATRRAVKTKAVFHSGADPAPLVSRYTPEERLERDALLWNYLPPVNHQGSGNSFRQASFNAIFHKDIAFGEKRKAAAVEHGEWTPTHLFNRKDGIAANDAPWDVFIENRKLGLKYTLEDLLAYRPLPDPYPYKDDGTGVYFPDAQSPERGAVIAEIGIEVMHRLRNYPTWAKWAVEQWRGKGDMDAARDGAIVLARYAYQFPSIESATYLCNLTRDPGVYGRDLTNRRRETAAMFLTHYMSYLDAPKWYDGLFDYIQGNQELAASIGRFVPWVKTPDDVVKLLDVYLVQMTAKRVLRYHYHTDPMAAMNLAAILGDKKVVGPWIDWMFSRTFVYPLPPSGIGDLMISGCDRSGAEYVGSVFYAQGEGASPVRASVQSFKDMGMLPERHDLTRADLYPKPLAHCVWQLNTIVAGRDFLRIGDVAGPDKSPGATFPALDKAARRGWAWSQDPRFAWILRHKVGRTKEQTDEAWTAIEKAAGRVKRAPWLDLKSRQVYNWAGILEAGHQHDDYRFRRALYLRTGAGTGHHHNDALDLQLVAHGVPMTVDGGQRPGYSTPGDRSGRVHNGPNAGHAQSWVQTLVDAPGARYLRAEAAAYALCRRQVALVDVDEGAGSTPLSVEQQVSARGLPKGVRTANSYVFDVCRLRGDRRHTYSFHGPVSDAVTTHINGLEPVAQPAGKAPEGSDAEYLGMFGRAPETWRAGPTPEALEVTWTHARRKTSKRSPGVEEQMLGANFQQDAPRKYTRLHLLGAGDARTFLADAVCHKWGYRTTQCMVRRTAAEGDLESAFVALIEPYVGEPFITERKLLAVTPNEQDAERAVAVQVKTRNGHTDFLFADGRPDTIRTVGTRTVAGEYVCVSTDAQGLRLAVLAGGTQLRGPEIAIQTDVREHTGAVTAADYHRRSITIDRKWPGCAAGLSEIGTPKRLTSATVLSVQPADGGSALRLDGGADYLRSSIESVDEKTGEVMCAIKPSLGALRGLVHDFTASNDEGSRFWRAQYLGKKTWCLTGAPVRKADFGAAQALRVWEYGKGDTVRQSTYVSLQRVAPNVYALRANVGLVLTLPGAGMQIRADGADWRSLPVKVEGQRCTAQIKAADLQESGAATLRLQ